MIQNQKGKNHEDIQEMNRLLVIRLLQKSKVLSRAEITKQSELNQSTVTNIINDFLDWGLVRETGLIAGNRGRRSIAIELVSEDYMIIGVRLARKYFSVGAFDLSGKCYDIETTEVDLLDKPEKILSTIQKQILRKKELYNEKSILGVGIALPGPFIKSEGHIAMLTETSGWQNIDIVDYMQKGIGLKVFLEHDANAAALAEWRYTQNYDIETPTLCIMAGQGVGAGIMNQGKIVTGSLGIAGEIGHMSIQYDGPKCECGNHGCLEMFCSTIKIQQAIREKRIEYPETICQSDCHISEIIDAYKKGDRLAHDVVNRAGRYLGYGIANLINIINPGLIIIGDELSKAGEEFLESVVDTVKQRVLPKLYENTQIVLSKLEDEPALLGTGMLVIEESLQNIEIFAQKETEIS